MSDYVKTNVHIAALFILANFVVDAAGMNAARFMRQMSGLARQKLIKDII